MRDRRMPWGLCVQPASRACCAARWRGEACAIPRQCSPQSVWLGPARTRGTQRGASKHSQRTPGTRLKALRRLGAQRPKCQAKETRQTSVVLVIGECPCVVLPCVPTKKQNTDKISRNCSYSTVDRCTVRTIDAYNTSRLKKDYRLHTVRRIYVLSPQCIVFGVGRVTDRRVCEESYTMYVRYPPGLDTRGVSATTRTAVLK